MNYRSKTKQTGITIIGLIFVFSILGMIAVLGLKIAPTVTEYMSIKTAIGAAKASASTAHEVETAFDKQAAVSYIEAISGKDLEIVKTAEGFDVSFAYQKKIPLVGPASLLLDYVGTTAKNRPKAAKE